MCVDPGKAEKTVSSLTYCSRRLLSPILHPPTLIWVQWKLGGGGMEPVGPVRKDLRGIQAQLSPRLNLGTASQSEPSASCQVMGSYVFYFIS